MAPKSKKSKNTKHKDVEHQEKSAALDEAAKKRKKHAGKDSGAGGASGSIREQLLVREGFDLEQVDPRSTPGFTGNKDDGKAMLAEAAEELGELQERLYAQGREHSTNAVLLVIQGMDTSGKGGVMRHVVGAIDPQGVAMTAFKAPSAEERKHPFLWRIRRALPQPGFIGVFDRSHYEDVLIARVRNLVPPSTWARRYGQINTFEAGVVAKGTTVIKVMLHISSDEQKARLQERLDRPDKHWKFNPGDIDERQEWAAYQEAYQVAVQKTATEAAPWYVVPADRKWYAQLAVQQILLEHLRELDPQWPEATFDVEQEKARLAAT